MSKGPTPRHSKAPEPVTIDLDATDVTPKDEPGTAKKPTVDQAAAKAVETASGVKAETAKADSKASSTPSIKQSAQSPGSGPGSAGGDKPKAATTGSGKPDTGKPETGTPDNGKPKTAASSSTAASSASAQSSSTRPGSSAPGSAKPAATDRNRGGGIGMVAAGVIGAVVALGGYYGLHAGGVLPVPGGNDNQALVTRVEGLAGNVEVLSERLASQTADGPAAQLLARVGSLESALSKTDAVAGGGNAEQLEALTTRLGEIESRIDALSASSGGDAADPALTATVEGLSASQSDVAASLSELQTRATALSEKIAALEQGQATLSKQLDDRLATLESRLDEPAQQVDLARAIAAAGLKSAIDRGGSFMSELEAFASVAPDDPAVPELRDLAASGVPSRSDLIERFGDAANQAIAAAEPVDPNAGLVDRLMSSALSVVKVRKVGEVEGDSAEAIAARAEARLTNGDLGGALAEWNALPEASRLAAADYGEALAARVSAEKLIAAALSPAKATPTPQTSPDASTESDTPSDAPAN
ncbi:mitofilin family membrane protein [Hoeflea sp. G2-23]|uniref:Mitofilin family membrane protein n=1 Tax=Hoeflea algicola TaxID=2983763 RepID=A0ABT3ZB36_9HYPH|nr:mitofilin family membrane protein [Hoeflea algicola]MCY0148990.1 mitofilin family membrane protein [Hoeflea algicola]